jgi:uncharacterized membrane protein
MGRSAEPNQDWTDEMITEFEHQADSVMATQNGYLQSIDAERLMKIATEEDLVLLLKYRPGDFLFEFSELVRVKSGGRIDDHIAARIQKAFLVGSQRTHLQDVEFSVEQLVEVAVRALSPGINDPFTAINCIDRLATALCSVAQRSFPSIFRYDEHHKLRVIARSVNFAGIVNAAFDPIRQYGRSSAQVTIRLLEAIAIIAACARREADRKALLDQALMIKRGSRDGLPEERDRADVAARFSAVVEALQNAEGRQACVHFPPEDHGRRD